MGNFRGWKQSSDQIKQKRNDRVKEFLYDAQREKDCEKLLVLVEDLYIEMVEKNHISLNKFEKYLEKYNLVITDKK